MLKLKIELFSVCVHLGESDPGRGPRGDRDPAEHRWRRRYRAHGAGRPAEDPQPAIPGTARALSDEQSRG